MAATAAATASATWARDDSAPLAALGKILTDRYTGDASIGVEPAAGQGA